MYQLSDFKPTHYWSGGVGNMKYLITKNELGWSYWDGLEKQWVFIKKTSNISEIKMFMFWKLSIPIDQWDSEYSKWTSSDQNWILSKHPSSYTWNVISGPDGKSGHDFKNRQDAIDWINQLEAANVQT